MFPPKKQYPFDNGGVGIGITPGVSDPLIGKMPPNYAGPSNPNIGMTTGGGYQAPQNAVSNPGLQAPSVSMAFNPVTNNPNPTNAGPYVNPLNTPGREYWEPTAQERAQFLINNPGDEARMREGFSRLIGTGTYPSGDTIPGGNPPPINTGEIPGGTPPPINEIPMGAPPPTSGTPPLYTTPQGGYQGGGGIGGNPVGNYNPGTRPGYANPSVVPPGINPGGGDTTNTPGPPESGNALSNLRQFIQSQYGRQTGANQYV